MPNISQILITGSSGLIGSALVKTLEKNSYKIKKLVRSNSNPQANEFKWQPETGEIDPLALNQADGLIHLAGENIAEGRWTEEKKQRLRDSRIKSTKNLCNTLLKANSNLKVVLMASATGYYGNRADEILDEKSSQGKGFLSQLTFEWEEAGKILAENGIRLVFMRIGVVLSPNGGALSKMMLPFQLGLGGKLGDGKQYMSWIIIDDVLNIIEFLLKNDSLSGVFNVVAPNPVTNKEFTKVFGQVLNRPTIFSVPGFAARLAFGELADEALFSSSRVIPNRLKEANYKFLFPDLETGLRYLLNK
ncbi:MAG: TIGR01777 family protein [Acidobacteria bacterium]|nr:TIGR01777 family protein [Acidobacteriota bacterium]